MIEALLAPMRRRLVGGGLALATSSVIGLALPIAALHGCAAIAAEPDSRGTIVDVAPDASAPSGWEAYRAASERLRGFSSGGEIRRLRWMDDALWYTRLEERWRCDLAGGAAERVDPDDEPPATEEETRRERGARPARGRQRSRETSPDGRWVAVSEDWNVRLEPEASHADAAPVAVTTDGTRKRRYGVASWVYGEELDQTTAMWWAPDSTMLVYYAFDERAVRDYPLLDGLEGFRPEVVVEGYPKPGEPNPAASLMVFDLATGESRLLLESDADAADPGYVYAVRFAPRGDVLLVNRTNRLQNRLEVLAIDPRDGATRVVLVETQATWQENRPLQRFLEDGRRFVWETERDGFARYELRDLDGTLHAAWGDGRSDVAGLERLDEENGIAWFLQWGDEDPLDRHLWRCRLDGSDLRRVTTGPGRGQVTFSPDGRHFVLRTESITQPPVTTLHDVEGRRLATLAEPDGERLAAFADVPEPERLVFLADDGVTEIQGWLFRPANFDPARRYPLLVDVYGGPTSKGVGNTWRRWHPACGLDCLVAKFDNRGTTGRGVAFSRAVYRKLGQVDLDDQAAGVRHLLDRGLVDPARVGIYGHSYGGFMAALAVLRHPDLFRFAVAGAAVTDWRHYDTIYTERYMATPETNVSGYDAGSCVVHASALEGDLLLMHGLMDDNVHPTNLWQLVHALQEAGRDFDLACYPTRGHGLGGHAARLEWDWIGERIAGAP